MRRIALLLGIAALWWLAARAEEPATQPKPIWLVVTRPIFEDAVKPLAERRAKEGFETVVSTDAPDKAIATLKRKPAFVLIVGDDLSAATGRVAEGVTAKGAQKDKDASWRIPSKPVKQYRWQVTQALTFPSDTAFGDLDGDALPDVPVGRLPVRTAEQVKLIIDKIVAWEDLPPSIENLNMSVWAGSAMYNPTVDTFATSLLIGTVQTAAPLWVQSWAMSGDPNHVLCGWPAEQPAMFERQARAGGAFLFMIGHGGVDHFFSMELAHGDIRYSADMAVKAFAKGPPAPPLLVLACYCGNFTSARECLAKAMVLAPGGPVAAIGATTESHPLPNYFSGKCMLKALGSGRQGRLGEVWLAAQKEMTKSRNFLVESVLAEVEGKLEGPMDLTRLRRDQALMYALLGDPATRLHLPRPMEVKVAPTADGWRWQAQEIKGAGVLHVALRPPPAELPLPKENPTKQEAAASFEAANASFAFAPIAKIAPGAPWQGVVTKPGTLRLATIADGKVYVATTLLKPAKWAK
ncbi:MAG: C25 family cysteine peptidase [Phycisphaerae bacterium]